MDQMIGFAMTSRALMVGLAMAAEAGDLEQVRECNNQLMELNEQMLMVGLAGLTEAGDLEQVRQINKLLMECGMPLRGTRGTVERSVPTISEQVGKFAKDMTHRQAVNQSLSLIRGAIKY